MASKLLITTAALLAGTAIAFAQAPSQPEDNGNTGQGGAATHNPNNNGPAPSAMPRNGSSMGTQGQGARGPNGGPEAPGGRFQDEQNRRLIEKLRDAGVNMKSERTAAREGPLNGMSIVVTGSPVTTATPAATVAIRVTVTTAVSARKVAAVPRYWAARSRSVEPRPLPMSEPRALRATTRRMPGRSARSRRALGWIVRSSCSASPRGMMGWSQL